MYKALVEDLNASLINTIITSFIFGFFAMGYHFKLGFILTLLLVLGCCVRYMLKRQSLINKLEKFVDDIIIGKPIERLDIHKESQLSQLHMKLNQLANNVAIYRDDLMRSKASMQRILNDISNHLIQPIEVLHGVYEGEKAPLDDDSLVQIDKLKRLVESMSRMVNLENDYEIYNLENLRVDDLIQKCFITIQDEVSDKNLKIHYNPIESVAMMDVDKSYEAIMHVINNKLRYARSNIYIDFQENPLSVYVKIYDDGEAIEDKARDRVFDKFYTSNSNVEGSLGIGLALAKEIMLHQNGDLSLEGKNTFVLRFSKKEA